MAWMAVGHLPDTAAALACAAAAGGLLLPAVRKWVSVALILAIAYVLSARYHAGVLGVDALGLAPIVAGALYVWWPQLTYAGRTDDR